MPKNIKSYLIKIIKNTKMDLKCAFTECYKIQQPWTKSKDVGKSRLRGLSHFWNFFIIEATLLKHSVYM